MERLLGFFVQRPLLVNILMIMVIIGGITGMNSLSYNAFPSVDTGLISVVTNHPGASAEDIELSITTPLEREFLHIDGVDKVVSNSIEGQSTIMVMGFQEHSSARYDEVEMEVYNAIDRARASLPLDLHGNPVVSRPENTANAPVIQLLVVGSVPEETLREIARKVQLELRNIEGVSAVNREGYRNREVRILLDDLKMRRLGISYEQVHQAINSRNVRASGGSVQSAAGEQDVLTIGKFREPKDVENVIIFEGSPGDFVRVRDIARVHDDFADPVTGTFVGGRQAIGLMVRAGEHADHLGTANRVKAYLEAKRQHLPADVQFIVIMDDSKNTLAMLDVLVSNAIAGIFLVVLVLMCFFRFRLTIWVALGIPVSIMMVFSVMPILDISVNMLSMAALILMLGILVDDAVVTAESIFRHHEYGHHPAEAAVIGSHRVVLPVVTSALTTIVALAPAAFLGGLQGKVFFIIPVMAILVLGMSLLECKFMLPAHIAHTLESCGSGKLSRAWFQRVEDAYESLMMKVVRRRYLFIGLVLAASLVAAVLSSRFILFNPTPETNIDLLHIKVESAIGTPLHAMEKKLQVLERELREIIPAGDLDDIVYSVGHHDVDRASVTEGQDSAWGVITIYLKPAAERATNSIALRDQLVSLYARREGFELLQVRLPVEGVDMGEALEITVIGNTEQRFAAAERLMKYIREQEGVSEVWSDYVPGKPIISLHLDHEALSHYGLTVAEVSAAVKVAFNGQVVGTFDTVEDSIVYRMQLDGVDVRDPASLYSLAVVNKHGDNILLRSVVEFEQRSGEGTIRHFLGNRATTVYARIDRAAISVQEINQRAADFLASPAMTSSFRDVSYYQGGQMISEKEQTGEVGKAFMLSILGIFFILVLLFGSYLQPFFVLLMIPIGVIGVLVAFVVQGMVLSFAALMGIAGLMGVIVNDALVMLDRLNVERKHHSEHGETLLHDRQIVECASVRLRPVVITTLTTCAGLFPAAYELGGANELITPMIMAMFWGVLIASFATLFLVPCLYAVERDLAARLHPEYAQQQLDEVIMYN